MLDIADRLDAAGQLAQRTVRDGRDGIRQIRLLTVIKRDAAAQVLDFFASERGREALRRIEKLDLHPAETDTPTGNALAGKTLVLTGTLTSMSREAAAAAIRACGGSVVSAVSGNTDFLVAGANTGASKTTRAAELGVPVIDENALLAMLDSDSAGKRKQPESGTPRSDAQLSLF